MIRIEGYPVIQYLKLGFQSFWNRMKEHKNNILYRKCIKTNELWTRKKK